MNERHQKDDAMIAEWFKNHIVERHVVVDAYKGQDTEVLIWRKPGTGIYRIDYLRAGNVLFVSGDVGEAVYVWPENVSLEWISGLDLDYFAGKCMASEVGRGYRAWSKEKAEVWLKDHFAPEEGDLSAEQRKRLNRAEDCSIWEALDSRDEWHHWLVDCGHWIFGPDYCEMGSIGEVVHVRCQTHLTGLRMAFERMAKDKGDGK